MKFETCEFRNNTKEKEPRPVCDYNKFPLWVDEMINVACSAVSTHGGIFSISDRLKPEMCEKCKCYKEKGESK